MLIRHRGVEPIVDASAFVAPTADLVGSRSTRGQGYVRAVLDSEASNVEVGECAIVCEKAVRRATSAGGADLPVVVGDHVFVGPHATLSGCVVQAACYMATRATVLRAIHPTSG